MKSMSYLPVVLLLALALIAVAGSAVAGPPQESCCHCGDCDGGAALCFEGLDHMSALCDSACRGVGCAGGDLVGSPCTGCDAVLRVGQQLAPALGPRAFVLAALVALLAASFRLVRRRSTR